MEEAEELLRIERLRLKTGTGLPADELRAEAALAGAQQDGLTALNGFYNASVALTVTLHLDSTVMLVPRAGAMAQTTLVREDLPIDDMLVTAVRYRTDLQAVRTLWAAAQADKGAAFWGGLGPQIQARALRAATARRQGGRHHLPAAEPTWRQAASTGAPRLSGGSRARSPTWSLPGSTSTSVGPSPRRRRLRTSGQHHCGETHPDRYAGGRFR